MKKSIITAALILSSISSTAAYAGQADRTEIKGSCKKYNITSCDDLKFECKDKWYFDCFKNNCIINTPDNETENENTENDSVNDNNTEQKPVIPEKPTEPEKPQTPDNSQTENFGAYETEVLNLINAERAKYGLSALEMDKNAQKAAAIRAEEIVKSFSHTRPNGSSCFTALKETGTNYRSAGENIAYGQKSPSAVVKAWMDSEGHRKNILGNYTKTGIGCVNKNGTLYWTQFFIS